MRICFISHSSRLGGAERVLLETIDVLQSAGVECRVVLPQRGEMCQELERIGVPFVVISFPLWMGRRKLSFWSRIRLAAALAKDTLLLASRILAWRCDTVYT